jgi:hypothetical protein
LALRNKIRWVSGPGFKDGKDVRLVSRNKKAFDYLQLIDALKLLPAERVILDGEIAALDEKGRSSFQLLQLFKSSGGIPLVYFAFDLLFLEGKDLRKEPLSARRKLLAQVLKKSPENIRLPDDPRGTKNELLRVAQEFGLEGLVAKKPNSTYESGRRSGAWVKFKITKVSGIRYRRLYVTRRGAQIFRLTARWLSGPGGAFVRRQSRHWFFGKTLGESLCEVSKTQGTLLSICKSAGENTRQMGPWDYARGHETLPLG